MINKHMKYTKYTILTILMVFLVGCSMITPKYDNNEYSLLVQLEVNSRLLVKECENPGLVVSRVDKMVGLAETLFTYTFYIPNNDDTYKLAKVLRKNIYELQARYSQEIPPSKIYCGIKSKILIESTQRALEAVGTKVR